jgi:diketogulonate reductase-like aldo/keto reductase
VHVCHLFDTATMYFNEDCIAAAVRSSPHREHRRNASHPHEEHTQVNAPDPHDIIQTRRG